MDFVQEDFCFKEKLMTKRFKAVEKIYFWGYF